MLEGVVPVSDAPEILGAELAFQNRSNEDVLSGAPRAMIRRQFCKRRVRVTVVMSPGKREALVQIVQASCLPEAFCVLELTFQKNESKHVLLAPGVVGKLSGEAIVSGDGFDFLDELLRVGLIGGRVDGRHGIGSDVQVSPNEKHL